MRKNEILKLNKISKLIMFKSDLFYFIRHDIGVNGNIQLRYLIFIFTETLSLFKHFPSDKHVKLVIFWLSI